MLCPKDEATDEGALAEKPTILLPLTGDGGTNRQGAAALASGHNQQCPCQGEPPEEAQPYQCLDFRLWASETIEG